MYSFVSTQSAYLTYADSYLVVETTPPRRISEHGRDVQRRGHCGTARLKSAAKKHSCFVLEGMNTLPGDFLRPTAERPIA